jgi:MurNAc alpha-1-phosphate uridylyltransferase
MIPYTKQAMVMAAGLGSRLRPLTLNTPKPLLPITDDGRCCLGIALDHLCAQNFDRIVVNAFHLADQIESFIRAHYPHVIVSRESEPLETGGGFLHALAHFDQASPVLIVNGDSYIEAEICAHLGLELLHEFNPISDDILLAVGEKAKGIGFAGAGDYDVDGRKLVYRSNGVSADYVFVSHRVVMPAFVQDCGATIERETGTRCFGLLHCFHEAQARGRLSGHVFDGMWCDLSTVETLNALRLERV